MVTSEGKTLDMRLQVDVAEDIKTWLKIRSVTSGQTMSEMVNEALEDYRAKVEKDGKAKK